jgi:hypothetical protein
VLVVEFDGDVSHGGFEDDIGRHDCGMCWCDERNAKLGRAESLLTGNSEAALKRVGFMISPLTLGFRSKMSYCTRSEVPKHPGESAVRILPRLLICDSSTANATITFGVQVQNQAPEHLLLTTHLLLLKSLLIR